MDNDYEIGTTISGKLLENRGSHLYVWLACDVCGLERWVQLCSLSRQETPGRCQKCMMVRKEYGGNWKGGRTKGGGRYSPYVMIWIKNKDDFFYPMVTSHQGEGGYVSEHRLVMAKHLGRCLHSWEIVHHRNGIKTDNRIENLQLMSDIGHKTISLMLLHIEKIEAENRELRTRLQLITVS